MSGSEKKESDNKKTEEKRKQKKRLDRELDQTFPASDPPSQTRPGHGRSKDDKD